MNALRMALDSIREKKGRSFLTMLGIIIGVTAVLVLVALVSGYNADITAYYEKLGVNKVNVTVNWYDTSRSVDVMDTLYDYGNGELGDMVLGVSPDLSTRRTACFNMRIPSGRPSTSAVSPSPWWGSTTRRTGARRAPWTTWR